MPPIKEREAAKPKERESDILRTCLDYLAAERIFHMRLNSGAFVLGEGKSRRFFRATKPGCADIIAVVPQRNSTCAMASGAVFHEPMTFTVKTYSAGQAYEMPVYWLECKTSTGKQSPEQKRFQREVEDEGMKYAVIRSLEDLKVILRG